MQRKRYTQEFKQQLIHEAEEAGNQTQVARRHGIDPKMLNRWVREAKHRGWQNAAPNAKKVNAYLPSPQEYQQLENENDKLKRILGEKDLEIEILRDLLKKNNPAFRTKLK